MLQITKTDRRPANFYFVGYPEKSKKLKILLSFPWHIIVESINAKFFDNGKKSGSVQARDIVSEGR